MNQNAGSMNNVVTVVADSGLCSGCGVCAGVCPNQALKMTRLDNGDLAVQRTNNSCRDNCNICITVCPFSEGLFNPRSVHESTFGRSSKNALTRMHDDVGYFCGAFVGYSDEHRKSSASGGLLSWTLEELLKSETVDCVAAVTCNMETEEGYSFTFKVARTVEEIRECSGSVYHQVEISEIVKQIIAEPGRKWAITGVPCLCAALRNAMILLPKLRRSIVYIFGLACGMYQNRFYTDMLLSTANVPITESKRINYREKATSVSPGNYKFSVSGKNGIVGREISYKELPYYLGKNAFFRINSCNYCMDVFSETADSCFMDAWLPEYKSDFMGNSIVLVRNYELLNLYENFKKNSLFIKPIEIECVVQSQIGHVRRKRQLIFMRLKNNLISQNKTFFRFSDKIDWLLQFSVQQKSKEAWIYANNRGNIKTFWRVMLPWTLLISIKQIFNRFEKLSSRIADRIIK